MIDFWKRYEAIVIDLKDASLNRNAYTQDQPKLSMKGFMASVVVMQNALMDKVYDLAMKEGYCIDDAGNMAMKAGEDLRKLIKTYTDIDTLIETRHL